MSNSMIVEQAEERLSVSRLGKSSHRETDKDLVVIADLLAEVKRQADVLKQVHEFVEPSLEWSSFSELIKRSKLLQILGVHSW